MKWIVAIVAILAMSGVALAGAWGVGLIRTSGDPVDPPAVKVWERFHGDPVPCGCLPPPR